MESMGVPDVSGLRMFPQRVYCAGRTLGLRSEGCQVSNREILAEATRMPTSAVNTRPCNLRGGEAVEV